MTPRIRIATICILLLLCVTTFSFAGNQTGGRVVLVIAGNTSIRDLTGPGLPHIANLLENGSAALMNVHTGRANKEVLPAPGPGMEAGCVTLGAGAMGIGGYEVWQAANASGQIDGLNARSLYAFRTGSDSGKAQVAQTQISRITRANAAASYRAIPGNLGSVLQNAGIKTAVVGNSDIPEQPHREAVAVAMNAAGTVDFGDVDSAAFVQQDPLAPFGVHTSNVGLLDAVDRVLPKSRFIVIDFGDTFRADIAAELCTDDRAALVRRQAATRLDEFIGLLRSKMDSQKDTLIILSPTERTWSDIEEERLAPVIISGPSFGKGILLSPSTRRMGVVTLNDIAPTILAVFGINAPETMVGRSVNSLTGWANTTDWLLKLNIKTSKQAQRQIAMRGSSVAQSVVVVLVTLAILFGAGGVLRTTAAWASLIPLALPISMLCIPLFYSGGLAGAVVLLVLLTLAIVAACAGIFRIPMRALVWLCGLITVALSVDMLLGAPLSSTSIAGYSIIEGARYYGIGNELMGTLLGVALIGLGVIFSNGKLNAKLHGVIMAAVFVLVFFMIGWPKLGANMGGAMAAVPAMGVAILSRRGWRPNLKGLALVAALSVLVIGLLFAVDSMRSGSAQSHVGRVVGQAAGGDASGVLNIAERKIALNFMLVSTSLWSRLLALSLIGSGLLYWWGLRRFGKSLLSTEESYAAIATCFGVAGAFAFNDSGVVAAATCAVVLWMLFALRAIATLKALEG